MAEIRHNIGFHPSGKDKRIRVTLTYVLERVSVFENRSKVSCSESNVIQGEKKRHVLLSILSAKSFLI